MILKKYVTKREKPAKNPLIVIACVMIVLFSFTAEVYADDGDDDDNQSEKIVNELNVENENNIINSSSQESQKPILNSRRYVVLDRKSGLGIYGKDEKKQTAMASTTKIMTRDCCIREL